MRFNVSPPGRVVADATRLVLGLHGHDQVGDDLLGVAHDRDVGQAVLADLGRVDVGVDDLRVGREGVAA